MLEALRRGSQGIVVKVLLAILILSFAVWGVADVFTRIGHSSLAQVGNVEISPDEYQRAFQNELNALSYRAGRRITAEQARAFGLDQQVLNRLIGWAAVDTHAAELDLSLSNAAVVESLRRDPAFHGADGKYSRAAVDAVMRQLNLSEAGFLKLRRQEELRRQLTGALAEAVVVPDAMIDALNAYREETRILAYTRIDPEKVVKIDPPDEAKLKQTYEANKREFATQPTRKLAVLILSLEDAKKRTTVTDEEAKTAYEQEKSSYDTPEKRRVQQISFPDKAAAEAAKKAIDAGQSFDDAAKAAGAKESDIDLGLVTKTQLYDTKIREAAFALEKDKVSDPIEGQFTTALLRVTAIEPGLVSTFDSVKQKVIDKLTEEKARFEIGKLRDEVDDGRAGGRPLKDIAEKTKLTFIDIPATDRQGQTPEGKPAINSPDAQRIVAAGFNGQIGLEQDPVELADGGFAWVDVLSITPAADRPFDDVKDDVKALYEKNERARQIREFADKLVERLKAGETMEAIATAAGDGKVEITPPVTRSTTPQGISRSAVAQAFALPKSGAGSSDTQDGTTRQVFQVKDVIPAPAPTKEQRERIATELKGNLENDTISAYVSTLQRRLGSSINQAAFDRLRGATQ
ncbi:MAG: SurA N-terminal domain-containing protein [Hyphomicrobiaceae bacterium]